MRKRLNLSSIDQSLVPPRILSDTFETAAEETVDFQQIYSSHMDEKIDCGAKIEKIISFYTYDLVLFMRLHCIILYSLTLGDRYLDGHLRLRCEHFEIFRWMRYRMFPPAGIGHFCPVIIA